MYYYSMILGDSDVVVAYKWGQLSSQYLSSLIIINLRLMLALATPHVLR